MCESNGGRVDSLRKLMVAVIIRVATVNFLPVSVPSLLIII